MYKKKNIIVNEKVYLEMKDRCKEKGIYLYKVLEKMMEEHNAKEMH